MDDRRRQSRGAWCARLRRLGAALRDYTTAGFHFLGGRHGTDVYVQARAHGDVVANGSSKQEKYSPIWGGGYSGLAIGRFEASRGTTYTLDLNSRGADPSWDRCEPVVEIALHPADLEYLLGYTLMGSATLLLVGPLFLGLLGVFLYRLAASRRPPDPEGRHQTRA